jgi:signal transduction histidine kinase
MRATMADLRHVVGALWDIEELAPRHASDLESIIRRFDGTDLAVAMDGPANLEALPAPIRDMVAAEIAEGLTEVVRHARAHHAVVLLQKSDNALLVNIADDGCGPPANDNVGFGLLGLR